MRQAAASYYTCRVSTGGPRSASGLVLALHRGSEKNHARRSARSGDNGQRDTACVPPPPPPHAAPHAIHHIVDARFTHPPHFHSPVALCVACRSCHNATVIGGTLAHIPPRLNRRNGWAVGGTVCSTVYGTVVVRQSPADET